MNRTVAIAPVRKSLVVGADVATAFEVFTARIDSWWPKSHGIGTAPLVESIIEPFVGGRWRTRHQDGSECSPGHVLVWEPNRRVVFSWEVTAQWKPAQSSLSEIEVRFIEEGPERTRVEVEHRDFDRMGPADGAKMRNDVDNGWPGLLALYSQAVAGKHD
ncbi:MAG TPA: SRPBCC family protein [Steroidobacteraceae bacterium]|nr:SRPBCC family protein [Steroidobacteraceae bacterium]